MGPVSREPFLKPSFSLEQVLSLTEGYSSAEGSCGVTKAVHAACVGLAVLFVRPPRCSYPGAWGAWCRCRGLCHARLVMVSTGRKMVPVPCLCADLSEAAAPQELQNLWGAYRVRELSL